MALYPMSLYSPVIVGQPQFVSVNAFQSVATDTAVSQDDNLGEMTLVPESFHGPVKPVAARPGMTQTILENVRRLGL